MARTRWYVGRVDRDNCNIFGSNATPTADGFPTYTSVTGPFANRKSAIAHASGQSLYQCVEYTEVRTVDGHLVGFRRGGFIGGPELLRS